MNGEFISIETAGVLAKLKKENKKMQDIIIEYDVEINRIFKLCKSIEKEESISVIKDTLKEMIYGGNNG